MDAQIPAQGLIEEADALIEGGDFEGAEEVLSRGLAATPESAAFFHFQLGRLYARWNKLSSAVVHFHHAIDKARDSLFGLQVAQELKMVRERQLAQKP